MKLIYDYCGRGFKPIFSASVHRNELPNCGGHTCFNAKMDLAKEEVEKD